MTTNKIMAIYGAGPGFGIAVARRFGREGYDLALVARSRERLERHVQSLAAEGIRARAFTADFTDHRGATAALARIREDLGPLDVLVYSALADTASIAQPLDLDPDNVQAMLDPIVRTPAALVRAALPDLLERGDGGLLFSYGGSALAPTAEIANVGIAMSALRYYVRLLHEELAPRGVYAGGLAITAFIENTPAASTLAQRLPDVPLVSGDVLAEVLWEQFAARKDPDGVAPRPALVA